MTQGPAMGQATEQLMGSDHCSVMGIVLANGAGLEELQNISQIPVSEGVICIPRACEWVAVALAHRMSALLNSTA